MTDSPRDRILAAINHETLDSTPTDFWGTNEVIEKLYHHLGCASLNEMYDLLEIDGIIWVVQAPYIGPPLPNNDYRGNYDHFLSWGMRYKAQSYPAGGIYWELSHHPLAKAETIEDLDAYPWPKPEWYDFEALPLQFAQFPDRAIVVGYSAIFHFHNMLRGLELSLMDPLLKPEFTHHLLQKIADTLYEYHARVFEASRGLVQLTHVTDDFGTQNGLMISPQIFREFYKPHIQRAIDLAKSFDLIVFHHNDGAIRPLIPELVEMGIDILNPIQWRIPGFDLTEVKDSFGDQICFHGGVDNQHTLPFGTPEDVEKEVQMLKDTLGRDGTGLIIASCHNLQVNTPVENIIAMYKAAKE